MNALPDAAWLNVLIEGLQTLQLQLLRLLDALGLVAHAHGQPAWPWAERLSGENLLIDLGQARRLGISVVLLGLSLLVLVLALLWRRRRIWLLGAAVLPVVLAPWPDANVVLDPRIPRAFSSMRRASAPRPSRAAARSMRRTAWPATAATDGARARWRRHSPYGHPISRVRCSGAALMVTCCGACCTARAIAMAH